METKTLLHDAACEQNVLGVMLLYPDTFNQSVDLLTADCFYTPINRAIYQCIGAVVANGDTPDSVAVWAYMQKHPPQGIDFQDTYLCECMQSVASEVTFSQNCLRLAELHRRRMLYQVGVTLTSAGTSEVGITDEIKAQALEKLQAIDEAPTTSVKSVNEAIQSVTEIVEANISGTRSIGIPTGFQYLDYMGGMQETDLWIIAAEFSQGKSALALDVARNAARAGYPCAFYSTEMLSTQLAARLLAAESGIPSRTILQNPLADETLSMYDKAIGQLEKLPIFFDDTSTLSVERIISSIRSLARKKGIKVAFVDYLQVLQTNEKSIVRTEEQFFGLAARKFKNLAKELQICIVLISQISRSNEVEPTLSRIRGSGQITEAADVVLLIYRPEVYGKRYSGERINVSTRGTAQIKLAKGRNIGTGDFICGFDAPTTHFHDLETIPQYQEGECFTPTNEDRPF